MRINRERLAERVQDLVGRYHEAGYFPSACVRVFDQNETLTISCAGDAAPDSLFDVASLTKIATATQILLLTDEGVLALEAPVKEYLPELNKDPWLSSRFEGITLYRLLTHTSSLPAWYPFYSLGGMAFYPALRYALEHSEPSRGVCYSDLNFMILGKLLEEIHQLPLDECLQRFLVKPLKLGKMMYRPQLSERLIPSDYGNRIEMQMCRDRNITFDGFRPLGEPVIGTVNDGNSHYYFHDAAGHAGIFAAAEAYERLCRFYMNTESTLLRSAQQDQPSAPGRGIGFQTTVMYPHGCGHTGFTGTCIYFSSAYHIGVAAFTNRLYYPDGNEHVLSEFYRALNETAFALGATS